MEDKVSVIVGVQDFYYAIMESDTAEAAAYTDPVRIDKLNQISVNTNEQIATWYGDNGPAIIATSKGEVEISFTVPELSAVDETTLLGKTKDENGIVHDNIADNPPYVAIGFASLLSNGALGYVWITKCKCTQGERSYQTREGEITFQPHQVNARGVARICDGDTKLSVRSDTPSVPPEVLTGWFTKATLAFPPEEAEGTGASGQVAQGKTSAPTGQATTGKEEKTKA